MRLDLEAVMDEFDELKPAYAPAELRQWNIDDLEAYIVRLKAEIKRVEDAVNHKKSVGAEAAALFGKNKD